MRMLVKAVIGGALLLTMFAPASRADGTSSKNTVSWETIIGIIQPANMVAGITGGGQPWSTLGGKAYVDLLHSVVAFKVKGLVLAGGNTIGTPGAIAMVKGTLVCNPATASPTIIDTSSVPLDAQGNASFYGSVSGMTAGCNASAIAFLIRISSTTPANDHWIANGAVQVPYP
jgi:hypothetical protein